MDEVFLYGCDVCQTVMYLYNNYGDNHLHTCKSCGCGTFHKRIVIAQASNLYKESQCYIDGEEENGKEKGKID